MSLGSWSPDTAPLHPLPGGDRPVSWQIAQRIREAIECGDYPQGKRLPGQPAIARHYGVSLNTAQRAVWLLQQAGWVRAIKGAGTYVRGAA